MEQVKRYICTRLVGMRTKPMWCLNCFYLSLPGCVCSLWTLWDGPYVKFCEVTPKILLQVDSNIRIVKVNGCYLLSLTSKHSLRFFFACGKLDSWLLLTLLCVFVCVVTAQENAVVWSFTGGLQLPYLLQTVLKKQQAWSDALLSTLTSPSQSGTACLTWFCKLFLRDSNIYWRVGGGDV